MVAGNVRAAHDRIRDMTVRGAERIAVAAAEALRDAAAADRSDDVGAVLRRLEEGGALLRSARPSAVTLPNAVGFVLWRARALAASNPGADEFRRDLAREVDAFVAEVKEAIPRIGRIGARRVEDGATVLTHCNSSTAIEVIAEAHRQGKRVRAIATETRPWGQGYLTAAELAGHGVPTTLIVDSAVRYMLKRERVDLVVVGADSVMANGAVLNKVGTSMVAMCAREARVQFLVAAQTLKFDAASIMGGLEVIEERDPSEVTDRRLPEGVTVRNPVFDVTPASYVDLVVTEVGAVPPTYVISLMRERLGWAMDPGAEK